MNRSAKKEKLRISLLERRRELCFEDVYRLSLRVQRRFLASAWFKKALRISLYSSFQNEVLTDEIFLKAVEAGKEVFFPKVAKGGRERHLAFHRVKRLDDLSPGSYEIPEPMEGEETVDPGCFDLIVVPGVAFDRSGGRIGFGKGYYDKALSGLGCPAVALAYEFQVVNEEIPVEPHDVKVRGIVTEKRVMDL